MKKILGIRKKESKDREFISMRVNILVDKNFLKDLPIEEKILIEMKQSS